LIRFKNIGITNEMHFNILCYTYSQYSRQHVSAGMSAIFRVMFLLQECSYG